MLQYKVPQNVGIEDRIVGPLTLRQLIILAVGTGTSYVLFAILNKAYELNVLEYIIIVLPAAIAAAAALIRINDISFPRFVLLTVEFGIKPKRRTWDHRGIAALISPDLSDHGTQEAQATVEKDGASKKAANLRDLSRVLDSGGFDHVAVAIHEDIDKADDQDLMPEAFFGNRPSDTDNMYWRANRHDRGKRLTLLAKLPPTPLKKPAPAVQPAPPVSAPARETALPAPKMPVVVAIAPSKPVVPDMPKTEKSVTDIGINKPAISPSVPANTATAPSEGLPRKKRRRKSKKNADAARPGTLINTTNKGQPVQLIQKQPSPIPKPAADTPKKKLGGEIEFRELQKGEIEINLD